MMMTTNSPLHYCLGTLKLFVKVVFLSSCFTKLSSFYILSEALCPKADMVFVVSCYKICAET